MATVHTRTVDEAKLEAFVEQAIVDMSAAISGLLLHIGDRLGLYKAMAGAGPITSSVLAARTGTNERYVREWLGNQAAGGYVVYNSVEGTFELPPEQAMVVADEDSPVFLGGAFETIASCYADHALVVDAFRSGAGSRLAHARRAAVLWRSAAVPSRLRRLPRRRLASRPGRGGREAAGGSERRRHRLRTRRVHYRHGRGVHTVHVRGHRHSRAVDHRRSPGGDEGRRGPSGEVRDWDGQAAARHRLRPGVPFRLPARDG